MQLATPPTTALQRVANGLRWFWRRMGVLLCVVLGVAWAAPALAEAPSEPQTLHVTVGKSEDFRPPDGVTKIVVAQPETAKVDQAGPGSLYVIGRDVGSTNLLIYADDPEVPQVLNLGGQAADLLLCCFRHNGGIGIRGCQAFGGIADVAESGKRIGKKRLCQSHDLHSFDSF